MKWGLHCLLVIALLASPASAAPSDVKVQASVSSPEVVLGEVFYLFVEVEHPPGVEVNLPASLPLSDAFEETDRNSYREQSQGGTITRQFELAMMAFSVGDQELPPIPVTCAEEGTVREISTEPVPIRVISYIGDGEETLRDIAPPVRVHRRDWAPLYVLGGVGAVFVAALIVMLMLRLWRGLRRRRVSGIRHAVAGPRKPPAEEALERLEQLEGTGALDADDLKPAYHGMSEILRDYIGRCFDIPALDLTTGEILASLGRSPEGAAAADRIRDWLEHSDSVKFAGYSASAEEARRMLYEARIFVEETRLEQEAKQDAEARVA